MIQTILELHDTLGTEYYFVSVSITNHQMKLTSLNSCCKYLDKTVDLTQLSDVTQQDNPCSLSFLYDTENYCFVDYGNAVVDYIQQQIPAVLHR
ncbi:hypothetical protein ACYSNR_12595 [Enterococcus sp. LJL128]|uniref:hypothetical protein n=1 Tax=Enterococcus sp. LJL51 TaxID=3416656 RepID=UPI003CEAD794